MKIAIVTVQVPFVRGGAEILAEMLCKELRARSYEADIITIPFKWYPNQTLIDCMIMGRLIDLTEANGEKIDVVIALKFPAFYVKHEHKVIWLLHQHRQAYDLWETPYGDIHNTPDGKKAREMIMKHDVQYIKEARAVFTIAKNTSSRLKKYNNIDSTPLYHPPLNYEKLYCSEYGDFVFYPSRINTIKRQRLLVESAQYVKSDAKIIIAGSGVQNEIGYINQYISGHHLEDRVKMLGFISEEEKNDYYARCLCVYFGAYDEDYGYITLESLFSKKAVIVHKDAGGPLEFVTDGENGYVIDENPKEIAKRIDLLYENRQQAKQMGENGYQSLLDKHMNWDYVINRLLEGAGVK